MKRLRDPQWLLILIFLGIIAGVPLIQMLSEVRKDDGVRALDLFSQIPTAENLRTYERGLEAANWAARASRAWLQFVHFAWLKDGGEKAVVAPGGWYFYKPGLNDMLGQSPRFKPANATNDPVAAIVDFRDQLAAQGIHLLVMPVPNKESIYPDRLVPRLRPGALAPRTQDLLRRLQVAGVEAVDLFELFSQARRQSDWACEPSLYLAQDTHWSPFGVALAAKQVARRLTELGWVQPGRTDYCERPAPVQRLGDIVRMLQAPLIDRHVPPESISAFQVLRQDTAELYKDGSDAELLVLGDSFMRIYQQDEPRSAGFIAHLAKELKRPLMSLVNDGGGATLVRQELRAHPIFLRNKKVVLWEFVERDIGLGIEGWKRVSLPTGVWSSSPLGKEHVQSEAPSVFKKAMTKQTHTGL